MRIAAIVTGVPVARSGLASCASVIAPYSNPLSPDAAMVMPRGATLSR